METAVAGEEPISTKEGMGTNPEVGDHSRPLPAAAPVLAEDIGGNEGDLGVERFKFDVQVPERRTCSVRVIECGCNLTHDGNARDYSPVRQALSEQGL